jgi:hypothetical protein
MDQHESVQITVAVPVETRRAIEQRARADHRTLSNWCACVLMDAVKLEPGRNQVAA